MAYNRQTLAKALVKWRSDPALFSESVLGFTPYEGQRKILSAVAHNKFVSVRSGHKCGKTDAAAILAAWFVTTHPGAKVCLTAPTGHQVQNVLWSSVKRMVTGAERRGTPLGGECYDTAHVGWRFSDGRHVFGLSTDKPEAFAGISAANLLFIVDEASGVDERIFEAVFGNSAGGAWVVMISNPTRLSGTFYDSHHSKRHLWETIHLSSLDTPNFKDGERVPGLAAPEWVAWAREHWGPDSPYFAVRVLGEFPTQGENSVIPLSLVEEARARYAPALASLTLGTGDARTLPGALRYGVDVARFGDDESAFYPSRGGILLPGWAERGLDGPGVAGAVIRSARALRRTDEVASIGVDSIGVGASVYDALRHAPGEHVKPRGVVASSRASSKDYPNLRSELWFSMREWLRTGAIPPDDEKLAGELVAPTYSTNAKGQLVVASKDEIKERLRRSPDRADAANIAVYSGGSVSLSNSTEWHAMRARLRKKRVM